MIKFFLGGLLFFSSYLAACSHTKKTASVVHPIGIAFNSICCGAPLADFLKTFFIQYNNTHKSKLTADIASGCGKEGEFIIIIKSKDPDVKQDLLSLLSELLEEENKKNKNINASAGNIALINDASKNDFESCRIPLQRWFN